MDSSRKTLLSAGGALAIVLVAVLAWLYRDSLDRMATGADAPLEEGGVPDTADPRAAPFDDAPSAAEVTAGAPARSPDRPVARPPAQIGTSPPAQDDEPAARALARQLVAGLPPGSRLALRPLGGRADGLPRMVGRRLYEALLGGLSREVPDDIAVVARVRLAKVYKSLVEFQGGDIEKLLRNASVDIVIICTPAPDATGILLSCSATRLEDAVHLSHAAAHFVLRREGVAYEAAVSDVAGRLVEGAPGPGRVVSNVFVDHRTGAQTELAVDTGRRLEGVIAERLAELAGSRAKRDLADGVLGTAGAAEAPVEYRLRGVLRQLDADRIHIDARLEDSARILVRAGAEVAIASLPDLLRPGAPSSAPPRRRYEAVAEAVVSERLDAAAARRAARNLARARVIAQAMALPAPDVAEVVDEVDGVRALSGYLGKAITVQETFHDVRARQAANRVVVQLVAEVVPVGTAVRPPVAAELHKTVYAEREPITLELRSEAAAHIGVFSWGADNKVVRLYPNAARSSLVIAAGDVLVLPEPGEGQLRSAPTPPQSNREDHEALIVVAAPDRRDFMALAPEAGASLEETMDRAVDGGMFLQNLAAAEPGRMTVLVLPYLVHR